MPDPRPIPSLRIGLFDDPPANTETSTPRTRRNRLHQALRATEDMAASDLAARSSTSSHRAGRGRYVPPTQRRRQRSPTHEDTPDTPPSEDARRRRPKRRKLDSDLTSPLRQPIKYGFYGQVEPGSLKLEIISCDGGEIRDPRYPSMYLGPQNVLRHDKSVYSSERSSSSIVVRHADDTPFCLEKLHIVGPEHGFTAPVREGLVYVSMTMSDLSKYMDPPLHARIHGVHSPPYIRRAHSRTSPERLTLSDALHDPDIRAALERADGLYDADGDHDVSQSSEVPDLVVAAEDVSSPVTLLSDDEPGPEDNSTQEVIDFRLQRLRHMRRRYESDILDNYGREQEDARRYGAPNGNHTNGQRDYSGFHGLRHIDAMMARSRMEDSPHGDELDQERDRYERYRNFASASARDQTQEQPDGAENYDDGLHDPNVTRARFQIRNKKQKTTIKFDPPISGRFILLKLWANKTNVDVQSIIAKGYGGSRFFPAIDFR